jgi:hypothetical protein
MFSSAPIVAKNSETSGIAIKPRLPNACNQRCNQSAEGADAIDHDPGGADEQNDRDHVCGFDETAWNRDHGGERSDRRRIHAMVRACDDDAPAGGGSSRLSYSPAEAPRSARRRRRHRDEEDHRVRILIGAVILSGLQSARGAP